MIFSNYFINSILNKNLINGTWVVKSTQTSRHDEPNKNFFPHLYVANAPRTVQFILIACLRVSHVIRRICSVIYLRRIIQLVFVNKKSCVICKVETEFLYII